MHSDTCDCGFYSPLQSLKRTEEELENMFQEETEEIEE